MSQVTDAVAKIQKDLDDINLKLDKAISGQLPQADLDALNTLTANADATAVKANLIP